MEIKIDELADAIINEMQNYSQDITDGIKEKMDVVGKECNEEIKKHITFEQPTGKYVKGFAVDNTYENKCKKTLVWHVKGKQASLTHLLENGHALRNGGRSKAFPHIKFGEDYVKKRMVEVVEEVVKDANGH